VKEREEKEKGPSGPSVFSISANGRRQNLKTGSSAFVYANEVPLSSFVERLKS
jgi:hypothetical protein